MAKAKSTVEVVDISNMKNLSKEELLSRLEAINRSNAIIYFDLKGYILYWMAMITGKDTQIIGSTWSNMFSVLLTNAFSIVGTIMDIRYATQEGSKEKK